MQPLQDLVNISRYFGQNKQYVIAGGGNTSYKDDEKIWIKSSGTSLAGITEDSLAILDREKLKIIEGKNIVMMKHKEKKQ